CRIPTASSAAGRRGGYRPIGSPPVPASGCWSWTRVGRSTGGTSRRTWRHPFGHGAPAGPDATDRIDDAGRVPRAVRRGRRRLRGNALGGHERTCGAAAARAIVPPHEATPHEATPPSTSPARGRRSCTDP